LAAESRTESDFVEETCNLLLQRPPEFKRERNEQQSLEEMAIAGLSLKAIQVSTLHG
jgi:hypothetical protein